MKLYSHFWSYSFLYIQRHNLLPSEVCWFPCTNHLMRVSWIKVQFSYVWLFATPWIAALQASLSITNSRSSLRLTFIESVMPSSHLILCCPLLLLPPIPLGEFNSDDHYIYYCGQESLRRNGVAIMVNKSPKCSTWMRSQKRQNDLCLFPRQTIQYHSNPSLCPNQ